MIAYLKGTTIHLDLETAILDVQGVGYEVLCSTNTLDRLSLGSAAHLFIHTHVREDAFVLYGFATSNEKEMFHSLIKVNGVGPKLAVKILSGTSLDHFIEMIEDEDVAGLSKIPKVGKKTAEQLVLSLKGKLKIIEDVGSSSKRSVKGTSKEILSALVNLGFKESDVQKVVQELPNDTTFEEGVRKGLSSLSGSL
ncbi:MAG: Holliday junction branch migration protein RuvA [Bdellovibrionota bacterium]